MVFPAFVGLIVALVVTLAGGTVGAAETAPTVGAAVTLTRVGETVTVAVGTIVGFGWDVHPERRAAVAIMARINATLNFGCIAITRNSISCSAIKGFGVL